LRVRIPTHSRQKLNNRIFCAKISHCVGRKFYGNRKCVQRNNKWVWNLNIILNNNFVINNCFIENQKVNVHLCLSNVQITDVELWYLTAWIQSCLCSYSDFVRMEVTVLSVAYNNTTIILHKLWKDPSHSYYFIHIIEGYSARKYAYHASWQVRTFCKEGCILKLVYLPGNNSGRFNSLQECTPYLIRNTQKSNDSNIFT
jgi:hypothetical protein